MFSCIFFELSPSHVPQHVCSYVHQFFHFNTNSPISVYLTWTILFSTVRRWSSVKVLDEVCASDLKAKRKHMGEWQWISLKGRKETKENLYLVYTYTDLHRGKQTVQFTSIFCCSFWFLSMFWCLMLCTFCIAICITMLGYEPVEIIIIKKSF